MNDSTFSPAHAGPSQLKRSQIPLTPQPRSPVSPQYRFEAPNSPTRRSSGAPSVARSLFGLGLGFRRGSHKPEIAVGPAAGSPPKPSNEATTPIKSRHRKAYVHHSPRASESLSPSLDQATSPALRPRLDLPTTDRYCLSYDVQGFDPLPLDDADHHLFSSSYRPLDGPAPAPARLAPAPLPPSRWSDCSSASSSDDGGGEPAARGARSASYPRCHAIPHVGLLSVRSVRAASLSSAGSGSSRSSSPRSDRSHGRKDSVATQATSAVSSPPVVCAGDTFFEVCESGQGEADSRPGTSKGRSSANTSTPSSPAHFLPS